jgi:hypothetical protein
MIKFGLKKCVIPTKNSIINKVFNNQIHWFLDRFLEKAKKNSCALSEDTGVYNVRFVIFLFCFFFHFFFNRNHRYKRTVVTFFLKLNHSICYSVERIIFTSFDIFAWVVFCSTLANDNISCDGVFPAK